MPRLNNTFPIFNEGDVEILLSRRPQDRYVVHSAVLSAHSTYFKASLSKKWSNMGCGRAAEGPISWRYHLIFGDDKDNDPDVPLLMKAVRYESGPYRWLNLQKANTYQNHEALLAPPLQNVSEDTASLFLNEDPWVTSDDSQTHRRMNIISNYRTFFQIMFHEFSELSNEVAESVKTLTSLLAIADAYGSLAILKMPIELVLRPLQSDLVQACGDHYFELIPLAIAAQSTWLFKEVICRLVGDPKYTDDDIEANLIDTHQDVLALVLGKRNKLREMMDGIEQSILMLRSPNNTLPLAARSAGAKPITTAAAGFRHEVSRHFRARRNDDWHNYAAKFRSLKESQILRISIQHWSDYSRRSDLWSNRLYNKFGEPFGVDRDAFEQKLQSLQSRASALIEPLFKSYVAESTEKMSKRARSRRGFLCMDVTEEELPWHFVEVRAD